MSGFPSAEAPIPASAVPSAPVPGRTREETLRAFLAGETILTSKGRPWSRNADSEAVARQELAEIVAARVVPLPEPTPAPPLPEVQAKPVPRCPWCGTGHRVPDGDRWRCDDCGEVLGLQPLPISR